MLKFGSFVVYVNTDSCYQMLPNKKKQSKLRYCDVKSNILYKLCNKNAAKFVIKYNQVLK